MDVILQLLDCRSQGNCYQAWAAAPPGSYERGSVALPRRDHDDGHSLPCQRGATQVRQLDRSATNALRYFQSARDEILKV